MLSLWMLLARGLCPQKQYSSCQSPYQIATCTYILPTLIEHLLRVAPGSQRRSMRPSTGMIFPTLASLGPCAQSKVLKLGQRQPGACQKKCRFSSSPQTHGIRTCILTRSRVTPKYSKVGKALLYGEKWAWR